TMFRPASIFRPSVRFLGLIVYICSQFCHGHQTGRVGPFRREGHGNRSEYTGENEENDRGFGAETDRNGKDSLDRPAVRRRARSPSAYHDSCDLPRNEEFKRGIGKLDGSSIKGFKEIHESDMVMNPDPSTFAVLPWYEGEHRTARFIVDVYEGGSHERFTRDSRYMAQKAAQFAADQGYDTTYWGPEIEFFVFDGIRLLPSADAARNPWSGAGYEIVSREAPWNDSGGKEFPIRFKEGYYPAPPVDSLQDFRNEACRVLIESFGMTLDAHHHEVATA